MRKAMNESTVRGMTPAPGEREECWDTECYGLHLRVYRTKGRRYRRSWFVSYSTWVELENQSLDDWDGEQLTRRQHRIKIGDFRFKTDDPAEGLLTIDDARRRAAEVRAAVTAGADPVSDRRKARVEAARQQARQRASTFKAMASDWLKERIQKHNADVEFTAERKRDVVKLGKESPVTLESVAVFEDGHRITHKGIAEDRRQLMKDVLPEIGDKPADEVSVEDIERITNAIYKRGAAEQADRTRALIYQVYLWASKYGHWRLIVTGNPAADAQKKTEKAKRDRVLSDAEIKRLWEAAVPAEQPNLKKGRLSPEVAAAFRIRMLTGQRLTEICSMRWEHIRTETVGEGLGRTTEIATWTIPVEDTKTRLNAHVVPLSPHVRKILDELRPRTESTGWVFGAPKSTMAERCKHAFKPWREAAQVEGFIGKDIRRTVRTGLARIGVAQEVRDAVLNHAPQGTGKKVYERYDFIAEKLEALTLWAEDVDRAVKGGKVIAGKFRAKAR